VSELEQVGAVRLALTIHRRGINEGRQCAREVDQYLMQATRLPVTGGIVHRSKVTGEVLGRADRAMPPQIAITASS